MQLPIKVINSNIGFWLLSFSRYGHL